MKTLLIHPEDETTDFLKDSYKGKDWEIIDYKISKIKLAKKIRDNDRIIMIGHGDESGLFGYGYQVIDSRLVYLLREKLCVGIWCHASSFFETYNLRGIASGMIISEKQEADNLGVFSDYYKIKESNNLLCKSLKQSFDSSDFIKSFKSVYNLSSFVGIFNGDRFYNFPMDKESFIRVLINRIYDEFLRNEMQERNKNEHLIDNNLIQVK